MYQTNESQNKAWIAILVFDTVDCEGKLGRRDEEDHYILIQVII